jgi:hypothetical protein
MEVLAHAVEPDERVRHAPDAPRGAQHPVDEAAHVWHAAMAGTVAATPNAAYEPAGLGAHVVPSAETTPRQFWHAAPAMGL